MALNRERGVRGAGGERGELRTVITATIDDDAPGEGRIVAIELDAVIPAGTSVAGEFPGTEKVAVNSDIAGVGACATVHPAVICTVDGDLHIVVDIDVGGTDVPKTALA